MNNVYEISIWEDVYNSTYSRFDEKKKVVIGSNTMTGESRAREPKLVNNINGTSTFSFTLVYNYIDTYSGQEIHNPYVKMIHNETKIKVKWKDKWYDLLVKDIKEDSNSHVFTYTCEDEYITELGRSGFNLEFADELKNNIGTAGELVQQVLDGTDWQYQTGETIYQETEEGVIEITTAGTISALRVPEMTSVTIPSGANILLFYSNTENAANHLTYATFWYAGGNTWQHQNQTTLVTNGYCCIAQNVVWYATDEDDEGNIAYTCEQGGSDILYLPLTNNIVISQNNTAKNIKNPQLSEYSKTLERYVNVYSKTENGSNVRYYGYKTVDFKNPNAVVNLVANPNNFENVSAWITRDSFPMAITKLYPEYSGNIASYNPKSYLFLDGRNVGLWVYNTGISLNARYVPEGFVKGEKYVFRIKGEKCVDDGEGNPSTVHTSINSGVSVRVGTRVDVAASSAAENYFVRQSSSNDWRYVDGYYEIEMDCLESTSQESLTSVIKPVGIQILFNSGYFYWIEDVQFFKKVIGHKLDDQGNLQEARINPGEVDILGSSRDVYKYFLKSKDNEGYTPESLEYDYVDEESWSEVTPVYTNSFEKIGTIKASNSNRFNILQTIAETFQCWIRFNVEHDSTGAIERDSNGKLKKYVTIVREMGRETGINFVYGIDLQGIQRNIKSSSISTKTIVPANENPLGENGFCTIARSPSNYPRTNFIYNFDYYITQKLLSSTILNYDLYNANTGLYKLLNEKNTNYDKYVQELSDKLIEKERLTAEQTTYGQYISNSETAINNLKEQIIKLADITGTINWNSIDSYLTDEWGQNDEVKTRINSYGLLQKNITGYRDKLDKINASLEKVNDDIEDLEEQIDLILNGNGSNIKGINDLIAAFERKYARFIQEGTWSSEDYWDDTKYYQDALRVAYTSSRPQISYDIKVLRVSDLEDFTSKIFYLGDICTIQDVKFFGYTGDEYNTPYKEPIFITEITSYFDSPEKDSIKVQNYNTDFDDLFNRITATVQSLQFTEGRYKKVAEIMDKDGILKYSFLQDAFNKNKQLVMSAANESVLIDDKGITITNELNGANLVRLTSGGIFCSADGGLTWKNAVRGDGITADVITAGVLNIGLIAVYDNDAPTFIWDKRGITAYYVPALDSPIPTPAEGEDPVTLPSNYYSANFTKYVRFDRFGIYGVEGDDDFMPETEEDVFNNARFGLTWKRFFLKSGDDLNTFEISSDNDLTIKCKTEVVDGVFNSIDRLHIGRLYNDDHEVIDYGMIIRDKDNEVVFRADSSGLFIGSSVQIAGKTAEGIANAIDNKIETWYQAIDPALGNPSQSAYGAQWTVTSSSDREPWWYVTGSSSVVHDERESHIGDLWYCTATDNSEFNQDQTYRWDGTIWNICSAPKEVFDRLDGKVNIYLTTDSTGDNSHPNPDYYKRDLWIDWKRTMRYCSHDRFISSGDVYHASDWSEVRSDLEEFANIADYITQMQGVLDGQVVVWYGSEDPTPTISNASRNYPANEWVGHDSEHVNDFYYNRSTAHCFQYYEDETLNTIYWTSVSDNKLISIIANAAYAADTVEDNKRRMFITTAPGSHPYAPYDVSDLWVDYQQLLRYSTQSQTTQYVASDWQLIKPDLSEFEDFANIRDYVTQMQGLVDGQLNVWYGAVPPLPSLTDTSSNFPASDWIIAGTQSQHVNDFYYDRTAKSCYQYYDDFDNSGRYYWVTASSNKIVTAIADAAYALDVANDNMRRIFVGGIPEPPYDKCDLWTNAVYPLEGEAPGSIYNDEFLVCTSGKAQGQQFDIEDWQLTYGSMGDLYGGNAFKTTVYCRSLNSERPTTSPSNTVIYTSTSSNDVWAYQMQAPKKNHYYYGCEISTTVGGVISYSDIWRISELDWIAKVTYDADSVFIDGAAIYAGTITTTQLSAGIITVNTLNSELRRTTVSNTTVRPLYASWDSNANFPAYAYPSVSPNMWHTNVEELRQDGWSQGSEYVWVCNDTFITYIGGDSSHTYSEPYYNPNLTDYLDGRSVSDFATRIASLEESFQQSIDGVIDVWYYNVVPTTGNSPANTWIGNDVKDAHLGDLYYNTSTGIAYRYKKENNTYSWEELRDEGVITALSEASTAKDIADSRRRVFVTVPNAPYDIGDLWANADVSVGNISYDNEILVCNTSRTSGYTYTYGGTTYAYNINDWQRANDYVTNASIQNTVAAFVTSSLSEIKSQLDGKAETWYQSQDPSTAWTTISLKSEHIGDLWYNSTASVQKYYRWNGTSWEELRATPPKEVFDEIDGKAAIIANGSAPYGPYDVNDLWWNTTTNKIYRCITSSTNSQSYNGNHWQILGYEDQVNTLLNTATASQQLIYRSWNTDTLGQISTWTGAWVTYSGESVLGNYEPPGAPSGISAASIYWTTKRPQYETNYPLVYVSTQTKTVSGSIYCTPPHLDDTTTIIDGGHIITGKIDARYIDVEGITITSLGGANSFLSITTNKGVSTTTASASVKYVYCNDYFSSITDPSNPGFGDSITVSHNTINTCQESLYLRIYYGSSGNYTYLNQYPIATANGSVQKGNELYWPINTVINYAFDGSQWVIQDKPEVTYVATCTNNSGDVNKNIAALGLIQKGTTLYVPMKNANTNSSAYLNVTNIKTGSSTKPSADLSDSSQYFARWIYYGNDGPTNDATSFSSAPRIAVSSTDTSANRRSWVEDRTAAFQFDGRYWRLVETSTLIDGSHLITGTIDADTVNVIHLNAGDVTYGTLGRPVTYGQGNVTEYGFMGTRVNLRPGGYSNVYRNYPDIWLHELSDSQGGYVTIHDGSFFNNQFCIMLTTAGSATDVQHTLLDTDGYIGAMVAVASHEILLQAGGDASHNILIDSDGMHIGEAGSSCHLYLNGNDITSAGGGGSSSSIPTDHSSTTTTYGIGNSTKYGHLKLSDAIDSTSGVSGGIAATPAAVRSAYNLANSAASAAHVHTSLYNNSNEIAGMYSGNVFIGNVAYDLNVVGKNNINVIFGGTTKSVNIGSTGSGYSLKLNGYDVLTTNSTINVSAHTHSSLYYNDTSNRIVGVYNNVPFVGNNLYDLNIYGSSIYLNPGNDVVMLDDNVVLKGRCSYQTAGYSTTGTLNLVSIYAYSSSTDTGYAAAVFGDNTAYYTWIKGQSIYLMPNNKKVYIGTSSTDGYQLYLNGTQITSGGGTSGNYLPTTGGSISGDVTLYNDTYLKGYYTNSSGNYVSSNLIGINSSKQVTVGNLSNTTYLYGGNGIKVYLNSNTNYKYFYIGETASSGYHLYLNGTEITTDVVTSSASLTTTATGTTKVSNATIYKTGNVVTIYIYGTYTVTANTWTTLGFIPSSYRPKQGLNVKNDYCSAAFYPTSGNGEIQIKASTTSVTPYLCVTYVI